MTGWTPAQRALARSYTTGGGEVSFAVRELTIDHQGRDDVTLTYRLDVSGTDFESESWIVTLPWGDKSFLDVLTAPAPDPERLAQLVHLVRALLEEWWDTKGYDRRAAKRGRRCT
ncbi:hypothetical protein OG897_26720 [Streptomyces sp. NBC_00237]|uniref:hypothetical protein n=1 Tax=Streptomyces sp. NBC_00237 TaxID=2975687 RepID=UPI002251CADE|nr:hypothetical protein [Streptomyces sp. NBC_00237]MCX5205038.1 hypothetical protein [Streptomyces sp. NBC_00237]